MRAATRCLLDASQSILSEHSSGVWASVYGIVRQLQQARGVARAGHTCARPSAFRGNGTFPSPELQWTFSSLSSSTMMYRPGNLLPDWNTDAMYSTSAPGMGSPVNAKAQKSSPQYRRVTLSNLKPSSRKYRKRRARGGGDKRAGRGHKGQKSRSGASTAPKCIPLTAPASAMTLYVLLGVFRGNAECHRLK